jgi:hypothetical protein
MKYKELKDIVKKHHLTSYGDIQSEVILYGGTIEDADKIYEEVLKK